MTLILAIPIRPYPNVEPLITSSKEIGNFSGSPVGIRHKSAVCKNTHQFQRSQTLEMPTLPDGLIGDMRGLHCGIWRDPMDIIL